MTHHRDLGLLLDTRDEFISAARHDKVDIPVLRQQRGNLGTSADGLNKRARNRRCGQGVRDDFGQGCRSLDGLLAALEDGSVARLDGQSGNVDYYFWARLEDDEQHTDGAGHTVQFHTWAQLLGEGHDPGRERERCHVADPLEHRVVFSRLREVQSAVQGGRQLTALY